MGQSESHVAEDNATRGQKLHKMVQEQLKQTTKFDTHDLQELYTYFSKENPQGTIKRKKFIFHNMKFTNFGDEEFWGHVFDLFDKDGNGEISFVEWVILLSLLKKGSIKERVKWLFQVLDKDNSGYLSRNELEFVFSLIIGFYPEACNEKSPEEFTEELFQVLDGNHDEKLSYKEFVRGIKQFPVLYDSFLILSEIVTGKFEIIDEDNTPQPSPDIIVTPVSSPSCSPVPSPSGETIDFEKRKRARTQSLKRHGVLKAPSSARGEEPEFRSHPNRKGRRESLPQGFLQPGRTTEIPDRSPSLIKRSLSQKIVTPEKNVNVFSGGQKTLLAMSDHCCFQTSPSPSSSSASSSSSAASSSSVTPSPSLAPSPSSSIASLPPSTTPKKET